MSMKGDVEVVDHTVGTVEGEPDTGQTQGKCEHKVVHI